jgi:hypothetical protein
MGRPHFRSAREKPRRSSPPAHDRSGRRAVARSRLLFRDEWSSAFRAPVEPSTHCRFGRHGQRADELGHRSPRCRLEARAAAPVPGDCESGGRDGERGAAGQSAHAVPMQGAGRGGTWRRRCSSSQAAVRSARPRLPLASTDELAHVTLRARQAAGSNHQRASSPCRSRAARQDAPLRCRRRAATRTPTLASSASGGPAGRLLAMCSSGCTRRATRRVT